MKIGAMTPETINPRTEIIEKTTVIEKTTKVHREITIRIVIKGIKISNTTDEKGITTIIMIGIEGII